MGQGNGFAGVVCAVYLMGGFILGALALALQSVVSQFAKRTWVKVLPLAVGVILWLAMLIERVVNIGVFVSGIVNAMYTLFGGWVYPYDLLAFVMSTVPILVGLVAGFLINREKKFAAPDAAGA